MTHFFKKCSKCDKTIYYSSKYKLKSAIENDSKCSSCSKIGRKPTDESRQKMSLSHKGHPQYKARIGFKHKDKTKEKISKSKLGKTFSQSHIDSISKSLTGRKLSENHIHNSVIGQEKSKYKRKPYLLGNELITIQGYENLTLDKLISESISVDKLKTKTVDKPKILYELNGRNHWYYPDCYISNLNMLVETKSTWTWKADAQRNLAKIKACVDSGYKIRLMVWNGQKELMLDTIYS